MSRHPAYTVFITVMVLLSLTGAALLVWGALHHQPAPALVTLPPQVHHG